MNFKRVARRELREATAADHERVDGWFSQFNISNIRGYGQFLKAQAAALLPLETAIDDARPQATLPDWDLRKRSTLIGADLHDLGLVADAGEAASPIADMPAVLGTVYVLEGSRLGGAMLARTVPTDFPRRFLSASDSHLWRTLIELLDTKLQTADDRAAAIEAARLAFQFFERSAQRLLEHTEFG